ncbi:hypothetical protein [Coprococcus sp. AM11-30B]|uniref:hypothetical protein n=1 Tax=Coprococcus sp. AM11-30B TaxID=2997950 RepID=UPI0022E623B3|nr:hypothetical protein [Coprococcus sp. AM11-30B]
MEPKPKERIVFDEDSYYGDEGEEMAINDLMERDGLTEDEVREDFTDDEIFNHQMEMKDFDYEEEMRALAAFFNGEKSDMSDFVNPYGGNHILVSGSVGRWNGTSTGIAVYKDFDAATDCSPSRFGQGNVFADCEIQKVFGILPGADAGGYSLSGEAKEAALSRFALPENRKAALDMIRKLNESRDSNENAL